MFGFSKISRYARRWRAARKQMDLESMIFRLPVELQKDIGWPAARDRPSASRGQNETHARPIL